jgi:hypothetical protein
MASTAKFTNQLALQVLRESPDSVIWLMLLPYPKDPPAAIEPAR